MFFLLFYDLFQKKYANDSCLCRFGQLENGWGLLAFMSDLKLSDQSGKSFKIHRCPPGTNISDYHRINTIWR